MNNHKAQQKVIVVGGGVCRGLSGLAAALASAQPAFQA